MFLGLCNTITSFNNKKAITIINHVRCDNMLSQKTTVYILKLSLPFAKKERESGQIRDMSPVEKEIQEAKLDFDIVRFYRINDTLDKQLIVFNTSLCKLLRLARFVWNFFVR